MAREINEKVAKGFANECQKIAYSVLSAWTNDCYCYWDDSQYAVRQFVLRASHSWGTAYCYWDADTKRDLTDALRDAGATNIKIKLTWNRVYCTFDMKISEQKKREQL